MYFITCFEKCGTNKGWLDIGASRTFGYYDNLNTCIQALNQNWCDMFEYLYEYAIVEKIGQGIHPECEERWFFKWDDEKKGFFDISEPEEFKHYTNLSLG